MQYNPMGPQPFANQLQMYPGNALQYPSMVTPFQAFYHRNNTNGNLTERSKKNIDEQIFDAIERQTDLLKEISLGIGKSREDRVDTKRMMLQSKLKRLELQNQRREQEVMMALNIATYRGAEKKDIRFKKMEEQLNAYLRSRKRGPVTERSRESEESRYEQFPRVYENDAYRYRNGSVPRLPPLMLRIYLLHKTCSILFIIRRN
mgnify:FL=1